MQNNLSKYLGRDDLKNVISSLTVFQGTAKESGNTYYALELKLINGFPTRMYLKPDALFAWLNALELLDTNNQMDAAFNV